MGIENIELYTIEEQDSCLELRLATDAQGNSVDRVVGLIVPPDVSGGTYELWVDGICCSQCESEGDAWGVWIEMFGSTLGGE